ncbi:hypothetical protein ACSAZL_02390 [Methanosarcina sp. T3]|uniref:hypothetical protein n=1 Tax=Methanosarcina sp. T3 TaxID=3439062 RepID=UPI003F869CB2
MDYSLVFSEAMKLFSIMLPMIFIGFFLSNLLRATRYLEYTSIPMASITEMARLPKTCSSVLTFFFLNSWSGMGMLSSFFHKRILGERDVIVTVLIAQLPKGLHSAIFFQAPVALAVLGYEIGLPLLFLELLVFAGIAVAGIFIGRKILFKNPSEHGDNTELSISEEKEKETGCIARAGAVLQKSFHEFGKVALVLVPTTFLFIIILNLGLAEYSAEALKPLMNSLRLPDAAVIVFAASFLSQIAVLSAAGTIVVMEQITVLQCLEMLFIARVLHLGIGYVKTSLPTNIALFGRKLGLRVTCVEGFMVETGLTCIVLLLIILQTYPG